MAREPLLDGRDLTGTAVVIGTALVGSGVLFAVLYAVSVYLRH